MMSPSRGILESTIRCIGLFFAFGTLTRHEVSSAAYVVWLAVFYAACEWIRELLHRFSKGTHALAHQSAVPPNRRKFVFAVLSGVVWFTHHLLILSAVTRLHPFRVCVGEHVAIVFCGVSLAWSSSGAMRGGWGVSVPLAVSSLVALSWANSITATHHHSVSGSNRLTYTAGTSNAEDRIHSLDSLGGMLLLLVAAAMESAFVLMKGSARQEDSRGDATFKAVRCVTQMVVGSAVMWFGSSTAEVTDRAESSDSIRTATFLPDLLIDAFCLVLMPMLLSDTNSRLSRCLFRHAKKGKHGKMDADFQGSTVRVATGVCVSFALHTWYHRHYRHNMEVLDETVHPVWHADNVLVLMSGVGLTAAVYFVSRAHKGSTGGESSDVDEDDPLRLEGDYALLGGAPAGLFRTSEASSATAVSQNRSAFVVLQLRILLHDERLRKLTIFLSVTLLFMLVELVYGMRANSLSLVSDAFHMLLDATSIALGLLTSLMAKWQPTTLHPLGFQGYEALSGLANGIMLVVVAVLLLVESMSRLFEPEPLDGDHLLAVAVGGLLVNVVGVVFFHDAHHGHNHCGDSHGHSHSHQEDRDANEHGHSHHQHHCDSSAAAQNMRGVYLHILSDLLGSVAVIVSVVVSRTTGSTIADPICSAALSCVILWSSGPLLRDSTSLLVDAFDLHTAPLGCAASSTHHDICRSCLPFGDVTTIETWCNAGGAKLLTVRISLSRAGETGVDVTDIRRRCRAAITATGAVDEHNLVLEAIGL